MSKRNYGVVGGGMLGLAVARNLAAAGHRVSVFEAAPTLGGLAAAWQLGPLTWDRFYHVILQSDAHVHRLLAELNLSGEFRGTQTRTGFLTDGKLHSMSNSVEFLRFPPLSMLAKLRLAATIVYASRVTDWKSLEQITAVDWLTKWSGRSTVEKIWRPLLRAKLGDAADRASAAFIWATIQRLYAARKSGLKTESFGCVRGGYARILERFTTHLHEQGVTLHPNTPVQRVEPGDGGVYVHTAAGSTPFDHVVVTAPAPRIPELVPTLPRADRDRLLAMEYQGIVCPSVVLARPLAGFYVTNITDPAPFTAIIEMTALVPPSEFGGRHLVYLPKYAHSNDPIFRETDDSLRERFLGSLRNSYPDLKSSDILGFQVARARQVFAVPRLGYSERVPPVRTGLPGVSVVTACQIVNGTLNVNETLALAERAMPDLLAVAPVPGRECVAV